MMIATLPYQKKSGDIRKQNIDASIEWYSFGQNFDMKNLILTDKKDFSLSKTCANFA
jgi:hypothetical protein